MTPSQIALLLIKRDDHLAVSQAKDAVGCENSILTALVTHFDSYPIDFILETLDHLGCCINLLADNGGNWIVNYEEMHEENGCYVFPVSEEAEREWASSIREAVRIYLKGVYERSFKPEDFVDKNIINTMKQVKQILMGEILTYISPIIANVCKKKLEPIGLAGFARNAVHGLGHLRIAQEQFDKGEHVTKEMLIKAVEDGLERLIVYRLMLERNEEDLTDPNPLMGCEGEEAG